ncbi:MAG: hypothetical protein HRU20_31690 [Pseudomonadales bacterium]|nr:hypothetical protein [Pseudomonadales bacterium]
MHLSMYSNAHPHKPEIISYANSSHYLVRIADMNGQLHTLTDRQGNMFTFNSQFEAESWLYQHGHRHAMLCLESADDELANEAIQADRLEIPLSH